MKKYLLVMWLVATIGFAAPISSASAQCPMCKMSAESNLKNGGSDGNGLNTGIIYMFLAPYCIAGTIAFLWWRGKKQFDAQQNADAEV